MERKRLFIILAITLTSTLLVLGLILGIFIYKNSKKKDSRGEQETEEQNKNKFSEYEKSYFGLVNPEKSYQYVKELNIHWERPYPGPFVWGQIEKKRGEYDFSRADEYVKNAQDNEMITLATIWPYTDWDQKTCHQKAPANVIQDLPELGEYRQKPCDMDRYREFIQKLVERYDGDNTDDMEGLKYPIKYWAVDNEPDIDWRADSDEYLETLKNTNESVKLADDDSKVLNGAISSLSDKNILYWEKIFSQGSQYVDIVNIHSIDIKKDLVPITALMKKNKVEKPIWVTKFQIRKSINEKSLPEYLVESHVNGLGSGIQKVFYYGIDDKTATPEMIQLLECKEDQCSKNKLFDTYKTMVKKIDNYGKVEKITESQYRFFHGDKATYIIWKGNFPNELVEEVRLTDINGNEYIRNASDLTNFNSLLYVEEIKPKS